jgi:ABC-2 type transport system ATP-binding protein
MEEADAYADRAILMAHGKVVAEGPTNELKARVETRTIRVTLPNVSEDDLFALPGVVRVERRGDVAVLTCSDSDRAIRALLERFHGARDIEIVGAGLEEAFVVLTGDTNGAP